MEFVLKISRHCHAKVIIDYMLLRESSRKFQPSERKRAFCQIWGFWIIGKIISSTTSWDAKNIPKTILSQINLGLKIVSHLIHECPGKINSAFNQSWDKEWFQLQAGISLYKGIRRKQGYPLFSWKCKTKQEHFQT